jgi:hypothetical protein
MHLLDMHEPSGERCDRIGLRKPPLYGGAVGVLISLSLVIYASIHSTLMM